MTTHTYLFTDREVADLVTALIDALDTAVYSSPEQERRWEALLKILQDDKEHA